MGGQSDDQYSKQETQLRLEAALRGAFAGPPTPLKDIPKRNGEPRATVGKQAQRRLRRQRKKRPA